MGVVVDQGLTFGGQVERTVEKMKARSRVLRDLSGKDWGWDKRELLQIYRACVESVCWYAAASWMLWCCHSLLFKLERAQRLGLRLVAGLTLSLIHI